MKNKVYIAHRGLYNEVIPENSMSAFALAVAEDMAIELDVQLTNDGKVIVFHDSNLKRMTGLDKKVAKCSYKIIEKLKLGKSNEHIPLLEDVLKMVGGKVYLDIEIKHYSNWTKTVMAVLEVMNSYKGKYSIKSFNPYISYLYKKNFPEVDCGVLVGNFKNSKIPKFVQKIFLELKYIKIYKPDFVAYNIDIINEDIISKIKKLNIPLQVFTLNTVDKLKRGQKISDILIVENISMKKD